MSIWDLIAQRGHELIMEAAARLQFKLPPEPAPDQWRPILLANVPLAGGLTVAEQDHLLQVARLLLDEVPFEGCAGLEVSEEIRVTIAATAALLLHRLPYPRFTKLVRVLVYPDTFLPRSASSDDMTIEESVATLGQAWMSGVVVLSWAAVMRDASNAAATGSVVVHEMAHILDAEDGIFDGRPLLDDSSQGEGWARVLDRDFARQRDAVMGGTEPPLNPYGARNHAEFFAVATEAYFCTPERLRDRLPALYDQLQKFFQPRSFRHESSSS